MTGHRELVAMRRAGLKPNYAWIADHPCPTDWAKYGDYPQICVDGDTPELEDFRFLVGVTAIVEGQDPIRVARIATACAVHAKRVIANVNRQVSEYHRELISTTDTEEVMTWPK